MSSELALAAVTAALQDLLTNALVDADLSTPLGGSVQVTALPPDRILTGDNEKPQLNVFLYQVTPNLGWRNTNLPSRDDSGARLTNPPLALDLHYLITAYSAKDFQADSLLGLAMQVLFETPLLTRERLRAKQNGWSLSADPLLRALAGAGLSDQIELIKFTPCVMNTEEMSKLWTAFQAKYRPSACYQATVALIESKQPARSPLPVLSRGPVDPVTKRDRGVVVQPDLSPPFPMIAALELPHGQPSVRLNEIVTVNGFHLDGDAGDTVVVLLNHPRFAQPAQVPPLAGATATKLEFQFPNDPVNFPAGVYALSNGFINGGKLARTTNQVGVALAPSAPTIAGAPNIPRDAQGNVTLQLTCAPQVWQGQTATLILGTFQASAEPFPGSKTDKLVFKFFKMEVGDYFVRLRVDGVESILINYAVKPLQFDSSQKITLEP